LSVVSPLVDSYVDLTLDDLIVLSQDGDRAAFVRLYDLKVDVVYRYVYLRVGGVDLAEDLTAATFLQARGSISSFRWPAEEFDTWLVRVARNLIGFLRSLTRPP
jgi:RNA polymerase sigma-70 factor, ECF subfamily